MLIRQCTLYRLPIKTLANGIIQYRWLCSQLKGHESGARLVKAVQGISKDERWIQQIPKNYDNRYGEDSWFMSSTPKAEVVGVADGVGGWRRIGIDSGAFAKELMHWCSNNAECPEFDGTNPRQLLIDSYYQMKKKSRHVLGSSTACLVALNRRDCTLHSANLGDSGFLVVRHGRALYKSDEQIHDFNTPYQLTLPPESKSNVYKDEPELATSAQMRLQEGDIIVLATDGLFDNVPESVLVRYLNSLHGDYDQRSVQKAANRLVDLAKELSINPNYQSPFSLKAKAHNALYNIGGKPDDITLILATVEVPKRD